MIRLLDILISSIVLLILMPLFLAVIVILKLTGEHEAFYLQERVGKSGKSFRVIKFVTMVKDSLNLPGGYLTQKDDPRVLPVGKVLRGEPFQHAQVGVREFGNGLGPGPGAACDDLCGFDGGVVGWMVDRPESSAVEGRNVVGHGGSPVDRQRQVAAPVESPLDIPGGLTATDQGKRDGLPSRRHY